LLTSVLNRIIPAEGQFPGAGDLGLADFVEQAMKGDAKLSRLFIEGLTQIEITAARLADQEFAEIPDGTKDVVLKDVEIRNSVFFEVLVRQCYNGYYTSPQIFPLIGYYRIPPEDYQHLPFDETLLEPQRNRAPFWRQV
jgi:hypothetical protein